METTDWDSYGTGRDPRCADCMVHCGYEPTAVLDSTANFGNMVRSFMDTLGVKRRNRKAGTAKALTINGRVPMQPLPVLNQPNSTKTEESRDVVGAGRN